MPPIIMEDLRNVAELTQKLTTNPGLIILKFSADWCGPCKKIQPLVDKRKQELNENVQFFNIDIDETLDIYGFFKTKKMLKGVPAIMCWVKNNSSYIPDQMVNSSDEKEVNAFFDFCISRI